MKLWQEGEEKHRKIVEELPAIAEITSAIIVAMTEATANRVVKLMRKPTKNGRSGLGVEAINLLDLRGRGKKKKPFRDCFHHISRVYSKGMRQFEETGNKKQPMRTVMIMADNTDIDKSTRSKHQRSLLQGSNGCLSHSSENLSE